MASDPLGQQPDLPEVEKQAWLRLLRSENVGPITFLKLINRFGGATEALEMLPRLAERGGAKRRIRITSEADARKEWDAGHALDAKLLARGDRAYPPLLRFAPGAPPLIWARGSLDILQRPAIAIVGSRNASASGRKTARDFAAELAAAGYAIVSGFARGIDTAAHEASLHQGTIAVFAGGLGHIYPAENERLADRILEAGSILSERAPHDEPRGRDFPARNRIISGLAWGVVVIEAAVRSGTLITARLAAEQGREVFAIPGHIADPRSAGTNALIKSGATFTTAPSDVLEILEPMVERGADPGLFTVRDMDEGISFADHAVDSTIDEPSNGNLTEMIFDLVGVAETPFDLIAREAGTNPGQVQAALLELEVAGRIDRQPLGFRRSQ